MSGCTKSIFCGVLGAAVGGGVVFAALHIAPAVCRGVVLKDLQDSGAYSQQLSKAMPTDHQDFLSALTNKGKN